MKYLVDAYILSEPTRPAPDPRVVGWLRANEPNIAIDAVILGELRFGILRLPKGKKRATLEQWFDHGIGRLQCLPWSADTALHWASLLARRRSAGKNMPMKDSFIAATAIHHGLTAVTRNTVDFRNAGVPVINPFLNEQSSIATSINPSGSIWQ